MSRLWVQVGADAFAVGTTGRCRAAVLDRSRPRPRLCGDQFGWAGSSEVSVETVPTHVAPERRPASGDFGVSDATMRRCLASLLGAVAWRRCLAPWIGVGAMRPIQALQCREPWGMRLNHGQAQWTKAYANAD